MSGYTLWNLILHIPLITICTYGLLIAGIVKSNIPNIAGANVSQRETAISRGTPESQAVQNWFPYLPTLEGHDGAPSNKRSALRHAIP